MAAAGESVVVVDCDMRRAGAGRLLGVRGAQGLSGYLADPKIRSWRDVVVQVEPKLAVIPTGPIPPNPVDLLGLERFAHLLSELRESYDWVILDSPPVSSVADSVVIGSLAEMAMVVMRHDKTDKEVIRRALQRLSGVGGRVIGAVLNDVDMTKSYNRDYYYGRFYYGSYYGEDKEGGGKGHSASHGAGASADGLVARLRNFLK
jgi:capsular exopolysaccharide synthesis family protein